MYAAALVLCVIVTKSSRPWETHRKPLGNPLETPSADSGNPFCKCSRQPSPESIHHCVVRSVGLARLRMLCLGLFAPCTPLMRKQAGRANTAMLVSNFLSSTALFSERRNVRKQKRPSHKYVLPERLPNGCCGTPCPWCIAVSGSSGIFRWCDHVSKDSPPHVHHIRLSIR